VIKKVVGILTLIIFITTLVPLNALAEETVNVEQISDKMPGDKVVIKGTTNLDEVTIKILRPNGTIMYVNVIKGTENGDFEDVITLPGDAPVGRYTVIVGKGNITAIEYFDVIKETIPELEAIELDVDEVFLKEGETYQLKVKARYSDGTEKDITEEASYESSNTKVVTVIGKGKIKAISAGNAVITIKYQGKEVTCEVKVLKESTGSGGGSSRPKEPKEPKEPEEPEEPPIKKAFEDIEDYPWAKEAIETLATLGIIKGTSETTFEPGKNITRAEFITLLVRAFNLENMGEIDSNFDDVEQHMYYYGPIGIAKKLGIVKGVGNNKFKPDAHITREDMMVMVARALELTKKVTITGTFNDISRFNDASQVSDYAIESVATLVREGIIIGNPDNTINPKSYATRAETAVMLYRILNKYQII